MAEPGRKPVAGIVGGIAQFGRGAECVGHALGGALVVRREAHAHMAIVEDGVVRPIGTFDLVERLRDQKALEAIARHEGQRGFKEVEAAQRRKLVEHEQQPMAFARCGQFLGQPAADLVEDKAYERFGAVDVGGRHDEVEADRLLASDKIGDVPVAPRRDAGHDGIAVEAEKAHGSREHARAFVVGFVQQLARRRCDDGMDASVAEMRSVHHRAQGGFHRAARIGQEVGDAGQRLVLLGVEDVQDRADKQAVAGLFPVVALVERSFRVDQNIRDVLNVADFPFALADFEQGIVGRRSGISRIEQQHAAVPGAEARRQHPVLALDVVDDAASRPGQQRRHDEADALAGAGRRKA